MKKQLLSTFALFLFATIGHAQCEPVTVPYFLGFETTENTSCVAIEDVNGGFMSGWYIDYLFSTHGGDASMTYEYDSDLPGDDWFFTHGLSLTAGVTYELTFRYRSTLGFSDLLENLDVDYGTAANAAAMSGIRLLSFENIDTSFESPFTLATTTITPTADGVYYIGFHCFSEPDQGYLQIDDISLTTTLATVGFDKNAFTFSPNPVKDVLRFSNDNNITSITIYNLLGQQVLTKNSAVNGSLDMTGLSAGPYVLKVASGNSVKTIKVIKQ